MQKRSIIATVGIAAALVVTGSTGAVAGNLIGSKDIRNNSVRSIDLRNGTIQSPQVERSSGFAALDNSSMRALQLTRLAPLPAAFENPTLTVHLRFDYTR